MATPPRARVPPEPTDEADRRAIASDRARLVAGARPARRLFAPVPGRSRLINAWPRDALFSDRTSPH